MFLVVTPNIDTVPSLIKSSQGRFSQPVSPPSGLSLPKSLAARQERNQGAQSVVLRVDRLGAGDRRHSSGAQHLRAGRRTPSGNRGAQNGPSEQVRRTAHPIRPPQRAALPPGYRQHLVEAGIIKPAGDPT